MWHLHYTLHRNFFSNLRSIHYPGRKCLAKLLTRLDTFQTFVEKLSHCRPREAGEKEKEIMVTPRWQRTRCSAERLHFYRSVQQAPGRPGNCLTLQEQWAWQQHAGCVIFVICITLIRNLAI